jgi:mannosyltransferase
VKVSTEPVARRAATPTVPTVTDAWARRYVPAVAFATVLAAVNAFVGIGANSVARDEGFSISTSVRSWSSFVHLSATTETNAWLYATVLKAWSVLGTSPGLLRVPSALAFVATAPLVADLGRRLFSRGHGAIAAVLVAVNGSLLMFAQQIRGYAFAVAFAVAATIAFVIDVRRPSRLACAAWIALVAAAASCQLHTVTVVLPHLASLLVLPAAERRWRRRMGGLALAGVVVVPVAVAVSRHEEGQSLFSFRLGVFRDVLYTFSGRGGVIGVVVFAAAVAALFATVRGVARRPGAADRFALVLVAAWIVLPFTFLLAGSVVQPTLIGRYLLFCVPAMALAMALLIVRLWAVVGHRRPVAIAAVLALVVGSTVGSMSWHRDSHTEPWDDVAAYVFDTARADDRLVVANDSVRLYFEYERTRRTTTPAGPAPGYPADPWGRYETGDQRYLSPSTAELAAVASSATRLWVVVGHKHVDSDAMAERTKALDVTFRVVEHRAFAGHIDVYLYERVGA